MSDAPVFRFERLMTKDAVRLKVDHGGVRRTFDIDGLKFDLNAPATIPGEYIEFADEYHAAIDDFVSRTSFEPADDFSSITPSAESASGSTKA